VSSHSRQSQLIVNSRTSYAIRGYKNLFLSIDILLQKNDNKRSSIERFSSSITRRTVLHTTHIPEASPPIDPLADTLADAIQELSEGVAELRRYIVAGSFDMAQWVAGDIQHTCWTLNFCPEATDVLCSLARMVYEAVQGRSRPAADFAAAIRPILDAMEAEVALLEQPT